MGSWNLLTLSFAENLKWDASTLQFWTTTITCITILGAMISSLSASFYLKYGKRNMILVMNVFVVIGTGACMLENMIAISVGRFIFGAAAGAFSVMCP